MLDEIIREIEAEKHSILSKEITTEPQKDIKTILIAEDDELIRRAVSKIISSRGYLVLQAENGAEALKIFRIKNPALILTDLCMPEMSGLDLLNEINKESPQTPVIIFSGIGTKPDIINALRSGAWDYILKPIQDIDYLVNTIEKVIVQSEMNVGYQDLMEKALRNKNEELEKELKEKNTLEMQLLHAKREWENTVDSITEAIALVDKQSNLIRVNMAMANLLDEHPAEVVGKECYLSTNGFNNKKQAMADHTAILRGKHLMGNFSNQNGDQLYEVTISPYYDHDEKIVIGAVYVARNITER